ncbi:F-box/FBD/LRR-repeat protein [Thalictrum thalictroides]|uniref:F-box/FBD/LRR-repeat protein n=1 Tax=Thalictrum thalictroides TaxID=46969 RepID=A0A7J6VHA4_THATH|nr:F-box/FBD/LRR-repeat protein [Thalictrum thalictroides]
MASDELGNLPKEVIEKILMLLPIRDAMKTCVLSSSWKNRWASMPELVFDTRSIPSSIKGEHGRTNYLAKFVDKSLMLHDGIISKFKLDNFLEHGCSDVDQWILCLSRKKTLKHLALLFKNTTNTYQIPSCLFSCQTLRKLELKSCKLSLLPSQYQGFDNIIFLKLYNVTITNDTFELLVNKIPLLRTLRVWHCNSLARCNINAPNLQSVSIAGSFESINFQNAAKVTSASFRIKLPGLSEALRGLDRLEAVCICHPFLEALWNRQSAVLHEKNFWEARLLRKEEDDVFNNLKTVTLSGFKGVKNDIGFSQFILLNALRLKTFCIFPEQTAFMKKKPHVVEKMMQFQRASTIAKVVFKNKVPV